MAGEVTEGDELQKWEYLEIRIWENRWLDSMGREGELPTVIRRDKKIQLDASAGLLNEFGEHGWELAGVVGDRPYKLFLKRPRS